MITVRSTFLTAAFGLSLLASAIAPGTAFAADEINVTKGATLAGPGLAAHGYDVVSFFNGQPAVGDDKFAVAVDGGTYRFTSQENLDKFKADPAKYEPAYGWRARASGRPMS